MPMRGLQPTNNSFLLLPGGDKQSIALAGWLLLVVFTVSYGSLRGQDLTGGSAPQGIERVPFNLDRFAQQSDVIVHGVVSSEEARWVDRALYTHYRLVVRETIQGDARSSITVAVLGGSLGNIALRIPDAPNLRVGDEVVFFGQTFEGQPSFKPIGLGAGLVHVAPGTDGQSRFVTPRGKPEGLDAFLDAVRSKKAARDEERPGN